MLFKSQKWYADWKDEEGHRRRKAFKHRRQDDARRGAMAMYAAAEKVAAPGGRNTQTKNEERFPARVAGHKRRVSSVTNRSRNSRGTHTSRFAALRMTACEGGRKRRASHKGVELKKAIGRLRTHPETIHMLG